MGRGGGSTMGRFGHGAGTNIGESWRCGGEGGNPD